MRLSICCMVFGEIKGMQFIRFYIKTPDCFIQNHDMILTKIYQPGRWEKSEKFCLN
jgi:hypothetical protein